MTPCEIIKKAYNGNIKQISRDTGIDYQRLRRLRLSDDRIASMTLGEWWMILKHGNFTDQEILNIAKWKGGT